MVRERLRTPDGVDWYGLVADQKVEIYEGESFEQTEVVLDDVIVHRELTMADIGLEEEPPDPNQTEEELEFQRRANW